MLKKNDNKFDISMIKCGGCGKSPEENKKFKKCIKCKTIRYCNRECQQKHWKNHKRSCRMINRNCIDKDPKHKIKRESYAIWRHSNGKIIDDDPDKQTALNMINGKYLTISEPAKNISMSYPDVECYLLQTIDEEEFIKKIKGGILSVNRNDDDINELIELHKEHIKDGNNVYLSNNGLFVVKDNPLKCV